MFDHLLWINTIKTFCIISTVFLLSYARKDTITVKCGNKIPSNNQIWDSADLLPHFVGNIKILYMVETGRLRFLAFFATVHPIILIIMY